MKQCLILWEGRHAQNIAQIVVVAQQGQKVEIQGLATLVLALTTRMVLNMKWSALRRRE